MSLVSFFGAVSVFLTSLIGGFLLQQEFGNSNKSISELMLDLSQMCVYYC